MDFSPGSLADEAAELRRVVRDLVALSTLPAVWAQSSAHAVGEGLAEVIRRILFVDLAYVNLQLPRGPFSVCVTASGRTADDMCRRVAAASQHLALGNVSGTIDASGILPGASILRAVSVPLGYDAATGALIAASARPDFPTDTERLLLGVAANAAAVVIERRNAEEHLQEASRAKDDFLATVSHELRTPLNAVLGWATMLSRGIGDAEHMQTAIAAIERNARTQVKLIEDLLDVSRFMSGTTRLEFDDVSLSDIVLEAVDAVRMTAASKAIELDASAVAPDLPIRADATRLHQIMWNLLSNAVKFTPPGGRIDVMARRDGQFAVVAVTDTGEGIEPEFLPLVFDRFRQADVSTTREHGGLGLGLWIVRHLAGLHGGTVEAHSAGRDQGSTFVVRLAVSGIPQSA